MMFEWIWKNRKTTDERMLDAMDRIAIAAERQAAAVELSHTAAAETSSAAQAAHDSSRIRNEAETLLIQEEIERRKVMDERYSST